VFGFVKRKILQASNATALREIKQFRKFVSVSADDEMAGALVATAMAVKHLRETSLTTRRFPDSYLHGVQLADTAEQKGLLSLYLMEVIELHKTVKGSPNPSHGLLATGYSVVIHSVRAVARDPEIFVEGRLLWRDLMRGVNEYPSAYCDLWNATATDERIWGDLFIPAMLAPEWKGSPQLGVGR
jgi:hypothetical protein